MTLNLQPSTFNFLGLSIFAERSGYRVSGRVEFPHPVCGQTSCTIDYSARRPDGIDDANDSSIDDRAKERLRLVKLWRLACNRYPKLSQAKLAKDVIATHRRLLKTVSLRSLQTWSRKLDLQGPDGLKDNYVRPPKRILTLSTTQALGAVKVCGWWAFRIANVTKIDKNMMLAAVGLLDADYCVADLVATIDCYYSYSCDRQKYPFKPFARWVDYDLEKWLYRACDENDYRRGLEAARHQVPLQPPATFRSVDVAQPKMRKRETLHRGTRRAIRDLHPVDSNASRIPVEPVSNTLRAADKLRKMGCDRIADDVVKAVAPGLSALSINDSPATIAEAIATLDDGYRRMLLSAAHGDRAARQQAVATMLLWWEVMPETERNNIDFRVDAWKSDHPHVTETQMVMRKIDMLLPKIRNRKSGAQKLFPAARIT